MLKISLVLFVVASVACYPQEQLATTEDWSFLDHEFNRTPLGDSIDQTSMKILKEAFVESKNKNVVASPLGVLILLSMYAAGAGGAVRDEIVKALGAANVEELDNSYSGLNEQLSKLNKNYLTQANKIYVDKKFELDETFVTKSVQKYRSEIEKVDFQNPSQAIEIINRWADEKTQGHIKKAVADDAIDARVVSVLTNVIFFQGHWNVPFNTNDTKEKDFYVDKSNKVQKPMMHLEQSLSYYESPELGAKLLELPYQEKGFRMVIVLPDEVDGLSSVMEKVAQKGLLTDVFALEPPGDVIVDLPKFNIETELDLTSLLSKIGVSKIFSESTTGIVKGEPIKVDKAFQKAFVKVDEEGATAGAFTAFIAEGASSEPPPPIEFKADHPFLFTILYEDKVLFIGTYAQ